MTNSARRTAIALAASVSLLALDRPASADEKQTCVAASEKAQQLKNAGKLTEAKEQLAVCSRNECPKIIQTDCTQWMRDVLDAIPTVVLAAKDKKGRDIVDVKVSIDGKVVGESLDGKPIAVDPGVHTFRFETKGAPAYEEQMLVRQAEKNRLVTASFGKPDDGGGKDTGGATVSTSDRGLPIPAIIVGGLGLVGGGVAAYLGLQSDADGRNLRDTCAPRCTDAQVQEVKDEQNVARIVGIASGVVFAAGVVLLVIHYTTGGSKSTAATKPGLTLTPAAGGDATIFRF